MRFLRYGFALWTGLAIYLFFILIFGQNGLNMEKQLLEEQARLSENLKTLKLANGDFLNTIDSLKYDQDALAVYMRQLGYGREDEKFVRIMGLTTAADTGISPGQVSYAVSLDYIPDRTIKIIAAVFGLAIFVYFLIADILISRNRY